MDLHLTSTRENYNSLLKRVSPSLDIAHEDDAEVVMPIAITQENYLNIKLKLLMFLQDLTFMVGEEQRKMSM